MLAPAKLNLYLQITGRRVDGYHELDSLVIFTDVGDEVVTETADGISLQIDGEFSDGLHVDGNLILQAARLLQDHYQVRQGARITLSKHLPIGAGLGGGSSDAAATLRLLNELWQINGSSEELAELALPLGADLPACIHAQPLHMAGIGEEITPLSGYRLDDTILLINPREEVLTPNVYREYAKDAVFSDPIPMDQRESISAYRNDLQPAAVTICPAIQDVLDVLMRQTGCRLARMCGSGATCFGLFKNVHEAEAARDTIQAAQPNWWLRVTHQLR